MNRRALASLASIATSATLLLAGCGDDSGDATEMQPAATANPTASTSGSTVDASSSAPSTESSADPAAVAIAEASLLKLADFPAGWQAVPKDDEDDDVAAEKRIAECVGVDHADLYGDEPSAESPEFTNEDEETISSKVVVMASADEASDGLGIVASETYRTCISGEVAKSVEESIKGEGATVGEISLNEVSVGQHGDEVTAFRVEIPFELNGFEATAALDFAIVRVDRALVQLTGYRISVGSLTTDDYVTYLDLATKRTQAALKAA